MLLLEDIPQVPRDLEVAVEPYTNVRSAIFRDWSHDEKSMYFSTRFGKVAQIHRISAPGARREQLTFFSEPVREMEARPQHNQLLYTMDKGGSEFSQLFLYDVDSAKSTMISDGTSRNSAVLWSSDGKALVYQSSRRNGRSNDIWLTEFSAGDKREDKQIVEASDGYSWLPVALSRDKKQLLILHYISSIESNIYIKHLPSGQLESVVKNDGKIKSRNYPIGFNEDGTGIFLLSDRNGVYNKLNYLDLQTKKETVVTKDLQWDVEGAELNPNGSSSLFMVNEEGYSRLYQFDENTFEYSKVNVADGIISQVQFSPSGKKVALTFSPPNGPSDIYVGINSESDKAAFDFERWTFSEIGGLPEQQFVKPELIRYPTFDQVDGKTRQIPAWFFKPKVASEPLPVVISIHGGPEAQARPYLSSMTQMIVNTLGAAVLVPNVRGSSGYGKEYLALDNGFKREDSVKDIGALLNWIKTQEDLDEKRIIVIGGSYGGYMVLSSAVHYSHQLLGAVDIVGISNFVTFLENTQDYRRDLRRVEYGDERDPDMRAHLEKISPNRHVDKITIPLLIVQGNNDPRVPVSESVQMVKALREAKVPVWYMNALNEGHGYRKKENQRIYLQTVLMFMNKLFEGKYIPAESKE